MSWVWICVLSRLWALVFHPVPQHPEKAQDHRRGHNICPNTWSNWDHQDPGMKEPLPTQWHRFLQIRTYTQSRPGVLTLNPLLQYLKGALLPGALKHPGSQDHRGSLTPRRSDKPRNTGVLTEDHSRGHNIFPITLRKWDPHKNHGNKITLPVRGTGSLQLAPVSRENLGCWHPTKTCNTQRKLNSQVFSDTEGSNEIEHARI